MKTGNMRMNNLLEEFTNAWKVTGDVVAASIAFGAFLDYLPPIAAAITILYTGVRLWESRTVQGWFGKKNPPADD